MANSTGGTFPVPDGQITATDPHQESVIGYNFPYRGQEQHGVEVGSQPWLPQDGSADEWSGRTDYEHDETEVRPIPVRIVTDSTNELEEWRALQIDTDATPRLVTGRNEARTQVQLINTGAQTVFIGPDVTVSILGGFPLRAGNSITIKSSDSVWAITAGTVNTLGVLIEFTVSN